MLIADITEYLDSQMHPELQEDYDNAGFLLGDPTRECTGALVALDLTEAVVEEAVEKGINLIVTHHPFIFGGVKRITPGNATGRLIMRLIKNDLAVITAHRYDAIILAVAHEQFLSLDIRSMLKEEGGIVYDVKGVLDRNIINGRL